MEILEAIFQGVVYAPLVILGIAAAAMSVYTGVGIILVIAYGLFDL